MTMLKDIIAGAAGVSHLSRSPLWEQDVATITPAQMVAFVAKLKLDNSGDEAESALDIAVKLVEEAADRGQIPHPGMLAYKRPNFIVLTIGELRRGLAFVQPVQAYAIMFALETGLSSQEVASFTHRDLAVLRRERKLSDIAKACLARQPRNLASPYVFWRSLNIAGRATTSPVPIMDLDEAVFDAFGLVWAELEQGYANLIYADDDDSVAGPLFDLMFGR